MKNLTEFQQRAAGAALERLLTNTYFDITGLKEIADLIGVELRGQDFDALKALHCVHYSKMDRVLANQVREKCLELLGLPPRVLEAEPAVAATTPTKRLRLAFWRAA